MKTKKFAVLLFTLILALGLFPMGVFAASTTVTETSTASITILLLIILQARLPITLQLIPLNSLPHL